MKKKNKKFKKRNQHAPQPTRIENLEKAPTQEEELESVSSEKEHSSQLDEYAELSEKYLYVKKDTKKLLAFIGLAAVFLVAFYLLDSKTSILNSFGDWIYRITNIQTG